MMQRFSKRRGEEGFTLIELLVVIVILGILSAVVVFAVRGTGDKGQNAAQLTDKRTVRTAEESFCAKFGQYGTEKQLAGIDAAPDGQKYKFLSEESTLTDVQTVPGGKCTGSGIADKSGFITGFAAPNGGSPAQIDSLKLAASGGNGYPTPFEWVRGPGHLNANYMFDPMLWKDATGQYIPWLATAVPTVANGGISADYKTYTFTLRSGVTWQDGVAFTANDVKFTFDYQKTGAATTVTQCFCKGAFPYINSVTVNSPTSVSFNLNTAIPNTFMGNIGTGMIIIPEHIWTTITTPAAQHTSANAYIGTGAYKLNNPTAYDPSTGVSQYDAYSGFFLGTPYVRQLRFITVTDSVAALTTKAVDAGGVGSEEAVTDAALAPVASLPKVQNAGGWNRAFHFNLTQGFPYNDVKFRQAVAYTVDRKALLQSIVGGRGMPGSMGNLAPSHEMLDPGLPAYDRDVNKSKALLDQLGIVDTNADGKRECPAANPCTLVNTTGANTTSVTPANFTPNLFTSTRFNTATADAIKQYLLDVGLDSTVVGEASSTSDARAKAGTYGMMLVGWGNLTSDADQLRTRLDHSYTSVAANKAFTSIYGWNNTANATSFMAKAQQQLFEPDPALRKKYVQEMQQLVAADVPIFTIYVPDTILFYQVGSLSAWYSTPGGTPPGPPGFSNKHVFITGKQFGLPAGF
ncbi:MAG TPA: ABC transporter substrate-binding protein [Acidimicrobiales bacterium]|nr:ABC transporter substrate-binding protein [Acidimicrobiales bacterium]